MQKVPRLIAIERIIENNEISSQDELIKKLKREGIICTQATLSRDLRQLGVLRIPNGKGGYRYSLSGNAGQAAAFPHGLGIVSAITTVIEANSMIVMKTIPGHANSVAVTIDGSGRFEIAGTIAGDDTLLIIPRDNISSSNIHDCLEIIFPGLHKQVKNNKI